MNMFESVIFRKNSTVSGKQMPNLLFTIVILNQAIKSNLPFPFYFFLSSKIDLVQKTTYHLHEKQYHIFPFIPRTLIHVW